MRLTLTRLSLCSSSKFGDIMTALRYYATILTLSSGSAFLLFLHNRYLTSRNARNLPLATHGHDTSAAVAILNPRKQNLFQHGITIDIPASRLKPGLDNDEILARFTQGFFGGWVFSPERWFFILTRLSITSLDGRYQCLVAYGHDLLTGLPKHQVSTKSTWKNPRYGRSGTWQPSRQRLLPLLDRSSLAISFSLRNCWA